MCGSMDTIAKSVQFEASGGLTVPVTPKCTRRSACDGISCDFAIQGTTQQKSQIIVNPCNESVHIVMTDLTNKTLFDEVYNDSGKYDFSAGTLLSGQLFVGIEHYNFSMTLSVSYV